MRLKMGMWFHALLYSIQTGDVLLAPIPRLFVGYRWATQLKMSNATKCEPFW